MIRANKLAFALCLFWGVHALAHAQVEQTRTRGELLYSTHCNACHTAKIHWRDKKLAADMDGLKIQVRRWQGNIGLDWTEEEITDVVRYLNAVYYRFPEDEKSIPAPRKI